MRLERVGLGLVLLVYLALAAGYAWSTPPWNNPDEPAHYNYVAAIAERGRIPVLVAGDWDADLLGRATADRFHPRYDVSSIRYEAHQPPLYYLLSAPVYKLVAQASLRVRVLALRGVSIVLGLVLGYLVYQLAAAAVPSRPILWPASAGFALLIPMQTAIAASINNDLLAEVLATGTLAYLIRSREQLRPRGAAMVGLLCGALLLTKLTVYVFVAMALGWLALRCLTAPTWRGRREALGSLCISGFVTALVSGWWFVRNGLVYGWSDPLASTRHAEVVVGQAQWAHYGPAAWIYFTTTVFHSFFAQFGWMTIVVDDLTYGLFGALVVLAIVGLMLRPIDRGTGSDGMESVGAAPFDGAQDERPGWSPHVSVRPEPVEGRSVSDPSSGETGAGMGGAVKVLFALTMLAVVGQLLYYNLSFIQAQGRYLLPAIGPIAILLAIGWAQLGDGAGAWRNGIGRGVVGLWTALALTTAFAGIADWEPGPRATALFAGLAVGLIASFLRLSPLFAERLSLASLILGMGALNLACLTRFVNPFYFG